MPPSRALAAATLLAALWACGGDTSSAKGLLGADCVGARDAACASNLCLVLDSNTAYCSQSCAGASDCPDGFLCLSGGLTGSKVCQSRGAGGVCGIDDDCPAGLKCDASSARCYVPVSRTACGACTSDLQCGTGGTCHAESSGETFCAPACGANDTCAAGFLCAAVTEGGRRCLPATSTTPPAAGSCRGGRPLCTPCTGDVECGKPGDLCVRNVISEEMFCGVRCTTNADCPGNFNCTDLSGKGNGPFQCVPNSNTCAGYCDSTDPVVVARECGLGSSCDLPNRKCVALTSGVLCAACQSDDDCTKASATNRCVQNQDKGSVFFGEKFCGTDCSQGTCPGAGCAANQGACQAGFRCTGIGTGGVWPYQCVPARGSCNGGLQRLGDPCDRHGSADCQSGLCGQFGTEKRCSMACTADDQCGARWRCCKAVGSDRYDCSQPAAGQSGVCAPTGGSFGDDCAPGGPPCAEGLCLDLGTAQLCTRGCDATHPCATGFTCQAGTLKNPDGTPGTTTTNVCFPNGGGGVGAACAFGPAACKSHVCLKKDSGNVCTAKCTGSADCPVTWSCADVAQVGGGTLSVCVPPGVGP